MCSIGSGEEDVIILVRQVVVGLGKWGTVEGSEARELV